MPGSRSGAHCPVDQVSTKREMRARATDIISFAGHKVGRWILIIVFSSTTRAERARASALRSRVEWLVEGRFGKVQV